VKEREREREKKTYFPAARLAFSAADTLAFTQLQLPLLQLYFLFAFAWQTMDL
jgi:hypothetical protein